MGVIVRDEGFQDDDWTGAITPASDGVAANTTAVDVTEDNQIDSIAGHLDQLQLIRIAFPSFADGRGFTLARRLRQLGFAGRLRAHGHVISDQYAMARRSGFDEVEIGSDLAARQGPEEWVFRADWREHDYQARLRGAASR